MGQDDSEQHSDTEYHYSFLNGHPLLCRTVTESVPLPCGHCNQGIPFWNAVMKTLTGEESLQGVVI